VNASAFLSDHLTACRARISAVDGEPLDDWAACTPTALGADAIDLWLFDLDADAAPTDPAACRTARGETAGRRLRRVLAGALCCGEEALAIVVGARGKPMLRTARTPPLHFNASRSGRFALIAVAPIELGIDIERRVHRTLRDEVDGDAADPTERLRRWTRREAVVKATGLGLGMRFRSPLSADTGSVQFGGSFWRWRDIGLPADCPAVATIAFREQAPGRCG